MFSTLSFFKLFVPKRGLAVTPNLSFRFLVIFLIGRKLVIFAWLPELELVPDGDEGAFERNLEQHGIISSSNVFVWRAWLLLAVSPLIMLMFKFETLIFLRGIWLTRPVLTAADIDVEASQRTFFFFAEVNKFTSFLPNAWIFPMGLIFVPMSFGPWRMLCVFVCCCCWLEEELFDSEDALFSFSMSWADETAAGSVKVVWRFLLAFVNCKTRWIWVKQQMHD